MTVPTITAALDATGMAADFTCVPSAGEAFPEWPEGRTPFGIAAPHDAAKAA